MRPEALSTDQKLVQKLITDLLITAYFGPASHQTGHFIALGALSGYGPAVVDDRWFGVAGSEESPNT
jgi:hypothetical protein